MSKFSEMMRTPNKVTPELMLDFLHYYKYEDATLDGCETIYETWEKNKAKLLERFRKHPNWDEENLAIVFKETEYERGSDPEAYSPFMAWVWDEVENICKANCKDPLGATEELLEYYINGGCYWIPADLRNKIAEATNTLDWIRYNCSEQFISSDQACGINERCHGVNVGDGLKLTKAIQKVCKTIGLDQIKDVRQAHENTDRMKDFGWNYQFQLLADAINPTKFKRITVISLNPLDYWGMSFGYKWASCHTIDLHNVRENPRCNFHGEWSAGTESYMLDQSTVIFYIINEDYEGNVFWDEDKMQRAVISINENGSMFYEGRVYPDGRDGGDRSLAQQFRVSMQKVISELWDLNNYWRVEKGIRTCRDNIISTGLQYEDYFHYDDVNISFNKDECLEFPKIRIGHATICPGCGCTHDDKTNILCPDCNENAIKCACCGAPIDLDYDYECIDGEYYCCGDCACEAGYHWCDDCDDWVHEDNLYYCENDGCYHLEENCYEDSYDGYYYYGDPEIETDDGNLYSSVENAEADGYHKEYFSDEWVHESILTYDDYHDAWFDAEHEDVIETEDGRFFIDEESAEHAGYRQTWIKEAV